MNTELKNSLNQIRDIVHQNAVDHGFHNFEEDEGQFITRAMMLLNTETSELYEAYRNNQLCSYTPKSEKMDEPMTNEQEEIADIIIRALDYCGRRGIDAGRAVAMKHAYNVARPYRHGGKAA